jgi:hypothetical protein
MVLAPISVGELLDKIAILQSKLEKIGDDDRRPNVARKFDELKEIRARSRLDTPDLARLEKELSRINLRLWASRMNYASSSRPAISATLASSRRRDRCTN